MRLINKLNRSYLAAKLRGRSFCLLADSARLHREAVIANNQASDGNITIGDGSHIRGELFTFAHGGKIEIGRFCYLGSNSRIWSGRRVSIGNNVLIAHNTSIMDNLTHPIDKLARRDHFFVISTIGHPKQIDLDDQEIVICDDAWIAANCIILRGVTIGEGAIVAAGAVVTKDVAPYTVVAGNPAAVIRTLVQDGGHG